MKGLTLLRFHSLGWSVTPTFLDKMIFFTNSRQIAKKNQCRKLKFSHFSTHKASQNLATLRLSGFASSVVFKSQAYFK